MFKQYRQDRIVVRKDSVDLLSPVPGPAGSILAQGVAAVPGVMLYQRDDKSIYREYVPAKTLRDSARSLARAPLTLHHPPILVDSDNVQEYGVGDLDGDVMIIESNGFQTVKMAVRRKDAIDTVENGEAVELSPGYFVSTIAKDDPSTAHLWNADGMYVDPETGQAIDCDTVQVAREYNHLAIVDMARGGPECTIKLDGAAVMQTPIIVEAPVKLDQLRAAVKAATDALTSAITNKGDTATVVSVLDTTAKTLTDALGDQIDDESQAVLDAAAAVKAKLDSGDYEKEEDETDPEKEEDETDPEKEEDETDPEKEEDETDPEKEEDETDPEKEEDETDPEKEEDETDPEKEEDETDPEKEEDETDPEKEEDERADADYQPPESARNNARRVLRWREEHGDEVAGMTRVGWTRARQLASGDPISRETVGRMAAFARHRKNAEVDPEYEDTPWRDAGYVAWLGWGGTTGIEWAAGIVEEESKADRTGLIKLLLDGDGLSPQTRKVVEAIRDGKKIKADADTQIAAYLHSDLAWVLERVEYLIMDLEYMQSLIPAATAPSSAPATNASENMDGALDTDRIVWYNEREQIRAALDRAGVDFDTEAQNANNADRLLTRLSIDTDSMTNESKIALALALATDASFVIDAKIKQSDSDPLDNTPQTRYGRGQS